MGARRNHSACQFGCDIAIYTPTYPHCLQLMPSAPRLRFRLGKRFNRADDSDIRSAASSDTSNFPRNHPREGWHSAIAGCDRQLLKQVRNIHWYLLPSVPINTTQARRKRTETSKGDTDVMTKLYKNSRQGQAPSSSVATRSHLLDRSGITSRQGRSGLLSPLARFIAFVVRFRKPSC